MPGVRDDAPLPPVAHGQPHFSDWSKEVSEHLGRPLAEGDLALLSEYHTHHQMSAKAAAAKLTAHGGFASTGIEGFNGF